MLEVPALSACLPFLGIRKGQFAEALEIDAFSNIAERLSLYFYDRLPIERENNPGGEERTSENRTRSDGQRKLPDR